MDLKLIFNPLYCTAVYSDDTTIRAVAMDKNFVPIKTFVHTMSRATLTGPGKVRDLLFPFTLKLGTTMSSGYVTARAVPGTIWSLAGMGICVLLFTGGTKIVTRQWPGTLRIITVAVAGLYGLIAMVLTAVSE
jgi:hypothetical protein